MEQVTPKVLLAIAITLAIRVILLITVTGGRGLTVPYCLAELISAGVIASTCTYAERRVGRPMQRIFLRTGLSAALGSFFFIASSLVVMQGLTSSIWIIFAAVTWGVIGLVTGLVMEIVTRKTRSKQA